MNRSSRYSLALLVSDLLNSIHLPLPLKITSPSTSPPPTSAAVLSQAETLPKPFLIPSISPETTNLKLANAVVTVLQEVTPVLYNHFIDRHRRVPQLERLSPSWL